MGDEEWIRHAFKVDRISEQAVSDLVRALRANPTMTRTELAHTIKVINDKWGAVAAQDAADTMLLARAEAGVSGLPTPVPQLVVNEQMADAVAGWARAGADTQAVLKRAAASIDRSVRGASRTTVHEATKRARTRYARVPKVGACAFCLMLASRGAVYAKDTVATTESGSRYHDHCHCQGREILRDEDLPLINRQLQEKWNSTRVATPNGVLTLDEWLLTMKDHRQADVQARRLFEMIKAIGVGDYDLSEAGVARHILKGRKGGAIGLHVASARGGFAQAVRNGEVTIRAPKTFFPPVENQDLLDWLSADGGDAVRTVMRRPDETTYSPTHSTLIMTRRLEMPTGHEIDLEVVVGRTKSRARQALKVNSVYAAAGDEVTAVLPNGKVVDYPLDRRKRAQGKLERR